MNQALMEIGVGEVTNSADIMIDRNTGIRHKN